MGTAGIGGVAGAGGAADARHFLGRGRATTKKGPRMAFSPVIQPLGELYPPPAGGCHEASVS